MSNNPYKGMKEILVSIDTVRGRNPLELEKTIQDRIAELGYGFTTGKMCTIVNARSLDSGDQITVNGFKDNSVVLSEVAEIVYEVKNNK